MDLILAGVITVSATISLMLFISFMFYLIDKHSYNKGICKKCGGTVRCFDMDSQGGYGYCCDKCGKEFWISWYKPDKENE
jgi:tRNA(Ile2) C34 agmatinyltransferase TiaS